MCTILPTTMLDYIELTMGTCVSVFLREREKEGRRDGGTERGRQRDLPFLRLLEQIEQSSTQAAAPSCSTL